MIPDVIIVGAGIAGLSAAAELKRRSLSFIILEAASVPGGRARSMVLASGTLADLGAHWLHGDDNPLMHLVKKNSLSYRNDDYRHMMLYRQGQSAKIEASWIDKLVDKDKAHRIKTGLEPDQPFPALATNEYAKSMLGDFAKMWNGLSEQQLPSARQYLNDASTPGGPQLDGGMAGLIDLLAEHMGMDALKCNQPVTHIAAVGDHMIVRTRTKIWRARTVLFTGSLAVIKNELVRFDPPLSDVKKKHLNGLAMGQMNKIIIELENNFLEERQIPDDFVLQLMDGPYPHFCHVRSAGKPLLNLFVSGPPAPKIETMIFSEALAYAKNVLAPVKQLHGFEAHMRDMCITKWCGSPYTGGAYASCLPGGTWPEPFMEGQLGFCGDTFTQRYPASVAGAFVSGLEGAAMVAKSFIRQQQQA